MPPELLLESLVATGVVVRVARVTAGVADGGWLILLLELVDDEVVTLIVGPIAGVVVGVAVGVIAGVISPPPPSISG